MVTETATYSVANTDTHRVPDTATESLANTDRLLAAKEPS